MSGSERVLEAEAGDGRAEELPIPNVCLHTLVQRQAAIRPDSVAAVCGRNRIRYGELDRRAQGLSAALYRQGVREGAVVGVALPPSIETPVAVLAVLQVGAAYLPLDPQYPDARLDQMRTDAGLDFCLTATELAPRFAGMGLRSMPVDAASEDPGRSPSTSPVSPDADRLAYVIFTSGSTGRPKGVEISHRGAANTILDLHRRFSVGPEDRVLALSSLSFDLSVYDLFGLLSAGGTVVLPEAAETRDPAAWLRLLAEHHVTIWNTVPATMELLVAECERRAATLPDSLRLVLLSGDWIAVGLPDRVRRLCPGARVVSLGGATEASIWSVCYPIESVSADWTSIPYGRPLANQTAYVLDDRMQPCPAGEAGELYLGGAGVARGYRNRPELSAERFPADPWRPGARMYRTGDRVRRLPDGNLEFLGRCDAQVKLHGFRIELGEVEGTLSMHPAVSRAVAAVHKTPAGGQQLTAYVVPRPGTSQCTAELREFLARRLPGYMVPARIVRLAEFPLDCNGKVHRGALPQPEPESAWVPPEGDVERRLCRIFEELFAMAPCGAVHDFFELGGDSLQAIDLLAHVEREFAVRVPYEVLLERSTVRRLGQWLSGTCPRGTTGPLVSIRPGIGRPLFCLPGIDGVLMGYRRLAEALEGNRPVFGLQPLELSGEGLHSLEDAAARLLAVMRRAQSRGPYHLVGYSLGGTLAWEMARQAAVDSSVGLLALLDTPRITPPVLPLPFSARLRLHWRNLRAVGLRAGFGYLAQRARVGAARSRQFWRRSRRPAKDLDDLVLALGLPPSQRTMAQRLRTCLLAYRPETYTGSLLLFRASDRPEHAASQSDEPALGWNGWAKGGVEEHLVPGTHLEVFRPPAVQSVAAVLNARFARAGDY